MASGTGETHGSPAASAVDGTTTPAATAMRPTSSPRNWVDTTRFGCGRRKDDFGFIAINKGRNHRSHSESGCYGSGKPLNNGNHNERRSRAGRVESTEANETIWKVRPPATTCGSPVHSPTFSPLHSPPFSLVIPSRSVIPSAARNLGVAPPRFLLAALVGMKVCRQSSAPRNDRSARNDRSGRRPFVTGGPEAEVFPLHSSFQSRLSCRA